MSLGLLGIVAGSYSAEYERPLSGAFSLGASAGASTNLSLIVEQDYTWGEVKARYYPNEAAPGGLALGVSERAFFGLRDTETRDHPKLRPSSRVQFGVAF